MGGGKTANGSIAAPDSESFHLITEFQIRGGSEDNSKIIFLISQQKTCSDPSLECDGSNDGSTHTF